MKPRTSLTDPLRIDELRLPPAGGVVGITFCPGKQGDSVAGAPWQRDLASDLDMVAHWGAKAVLTLIEPHEMAMLQVPDLGPQVRARGIDWFHLPIVDLRAPGRRFESAWPAASTAVRRILERGERALVHCRGGRGRAGTVAACVAIEMGMTSPDAVCAVRRARHGAIETPEQMHYVHAYADRLGVRKTADPAPPSPQ